MSAVTLDNVSKVYPGSSVNAVEDVNLAISDGEFFTLLGPSGCGKTTILRMIAGFIFPTRGRILFDDRDVTYVPPNRRDTAMVFQSYALFPHLTVNENVAFGLRVRKVREADLRRRVAEALEQVHLGGLGERRIDQLSGGQQQRVALARALVLRPSLLLLDEPLSNLDAKLREETRTEIRRLQKEAGITAVYVTHDQAEALAMSDRLVVLEAGRAHQVGTPLEVYNAPATPFVARFIGKSNLIEGRVAQLEDGYVAVDLGSGLSLRAQVQRRNPGIELAPGKRVTMVIRPEQLELARGETGNVLAGTVRDVEFNGPNVEYEVDAPGMELLAALPGHAGDLLEPGSPIRLRVPPDLVYLVE